MFYKYLIRFDDGQEKIIDIRLDPSTLTIQPGQDGDFPDWTRLDCGKCSVCPFDGASRKYCPVALNLSGVMGMFFDKASTTMVDARVLTREREYFKRTSLQTALSSVIGIYMVTSGCPVMEILKPMVRHHLPFASLKETMHRSVSFYLMEQYLLKKKGLEPDWELKKLNEAYKNIEVVNLAIVDRVRTFSVKDANYNALIILDVFAKMVPFSLGYNLPAKGTELS